MRIKQINLVKLIKTALLMVLAAAALTASAMAANVGGATVEASALNLRESADTSSRIITVAPRGSAVIVMEKASDGWLKVFYKGYEGYMSQQYLSQSQSLAGQFGTGSIKGSSVRMRSEPGYNAAIKAYYNTGTVMNVVGVSGEWLKVTYNGLEGYVHSDYILFQQLPAQPRLRGQIREAQRSPMLRPLVRPL